MPQRVDEVFASAACEAPRSTHLLLADGTEASYGETYARAARLAGALAACGLSRGERVAGFLRNSREIIEFYIACGIANLIGIAINGMSTAREVERILADSSPRAIIAEQALLKNAPSGACLGDMCLRVVTHSAIPPAGWRTYDSLIADSSGLAASPDATPDEPAMMIYSSGTTGNPKGVLLRHGALVENAAMTLEVLGTTAADRYMSILPLFSSFGHTFDFLQVGLLRASLVLLEQFDERRAVELIERFKVTFLAGVPTMFARMFDRANIGGHDISALRLIDVGGGPVSTRLKQTLSKDYGIEVVESYGLTEISPVASVQPPGQDNPVGSCGPPLPGIEVRVVRLDGVPAAPGEPGELYFRSPTFMIGYWRQPELTAEVLKDGMLRSGDVGKIDERGHIHILDRTKDMIVSNGFNVYPKEVENAICELAQVQSAAVVGVPDEIAGERIHAFVVIKPGQELIEAVVVEHCGRTLSAFKRPKAVHFIDAMPLTGSGKIRRVVLREMLRQFGESRA
ncbi:MAG: AMP-binding protein [Hyphomicrobiaceae bacterium]|nr:AMP-binding protein [Hyphomicrobiaceae bacterium]